MGKTLKGVPNHTEPLKHWSQGFGICSHGVVPFRHQGTAERIAAQAEAAIGERMEVVPHDDFWAFRPVES
jgi:hypothetical protein